VRNVLILGCGRSGTSLAAGTLAGAGYFMGEGLHPARFSNPKGFFESGQINRLNEAILALVLPARPVDPVGARLFRDRPLQGQRWLSHVPLGTDFAALPGPLVARMQEAVGRAPFCFKDPRFCYTLPAWRPWLGSDTAFLCVFRHPAIAVESILKECRDMPNLRTLAIDFERALLVWSLMYRHVLGVHRHRGDWLFVHYDQFFEGRTLDRVAAFAEAPLDRSFPDRALSRTRPVREVSRVARSLYHTLCALAGHEGEPAGAARG
jgi:hypothetical protein